MKAVLRFVGDLMGMWGYMIELFLLIVLLTMPVWLGLGGAIWLVWR